MVRTSITSQILMTMFLFTHTAFLSRIIHVCVLCQTNTRGRWTSLSLDSRNGTASIQRAELMLWKFRMQQVCNSLCCLENLTLQCLLNCMKTCTVNPGYIELEGDCEIVQCIDDLKHQICLFEALKQCTCLICFPETVTSSSLAICRRYATDQCENKSHLILFERTM